MAAKKRFLLRIDPRLYDALHRWSADELRSVNAQIEFLLSEAVRKAGRARAEPSEQPPTTTEEGSTDEPSSDA
ncbi:MAG: hypothetical protein AAF799_46265 [Myxococcota bacterium]